MGKQIRHRKTSPIFRMITIVLACWLALAGVLIHTQPVQAATLPVAFSGDAVPAVVGTSWEGEFSLIGGTEPFNCSISGALPAGMVVNNCILSGVPTNIGTTTLTVNVTDSASDGGNSGSTTFVFTAEAETTTTLSIRSGHPDGTATYMVGFPVWVRAEVKYQSDFLAGEKPAGKVEISSGTGGPTCSIDLQNGAGECALVFSATGNKTINAAYSKTGFARASSDSVSRNIQPLVLAPMLNAGDDHTCYLDADGMMTCWGYEGGFELHDDDSEGDTTPEPSGPYSKISAGGHQTCGLKTDGTIECWGENTDVTHPSNIPQGTFVDISAGYEYVCAIDNINQLHCWGNIAASDPLLTNMPGEKVTAVSAGNKFACAIQKSNNQPICWGADAVSPGAVTVKQLAVGNTHACAIKTDGNLVCWGLAGSPPTGTFKAVTSGSDYSCAQKADETLTCWGTNVPPALDTATSFSQFDSGFLHTCALKPTGETHTLSCWGDNKHAKAPRITLVPSLLTGYYPNGRSFEQTFTAAGGSEPHTLSLTSSNLPAGFTLVDGTLSGTPVNPGTLSFTLTAQENFAASNLPLELTPGQQTYTIPVYDPATTTGFTLSKSNVNAGDSVLATVNVGQLAAEPALTGSVEVSSLDREGVCRAEVGADGTAQCHLYFSTPGEKTVTATYEGDLYFDPSTSSARTITVHPVVINPVVAAGGGFSCSIDSDGQLTCWGDNDSDKAAPPTTGAYKQMDLGASHACALGLNRQVTCWGWNGYGLTTPPTITDALQVASGDNHSCALLNGGRVRCWGNNEDGQGSVTTNSTYGSNFSQIAAGANHTCGLTQEKEALRCWGTLEFNSFGPFTDIAAGGNFACGLNADSSVSCWGGLADSSGPYTDFTVGEDFACGLKIDGSVNCWGGMTKGLPGPFSQISAGEDHACGLLTGGGIQCWGGNSHGQAPVINITPELLGPMDVGTNWNGHITAMGGRPGAYDYSIRSGALPTGLNLSSTTGLISGTLTEAGIYNFSIQAQEADYQPAIAATQAYEVTVKGRVDASIDAALPANAMVGQPVQVTFSVHAQTGDEMGAEPTGTVTVTADDNECIVDLVDGEGNCTLLFATPGTKTLSITYPGDGLYQPGQSSAEYEVIPFSQPVQIRTGGTRTYVHHPDGAVNCLGGTCESEALPGTFTRFDVGSDFACGLRFDDSAKGEIVCRADDGATAPEFTNGPYIDLSVGVNHACALKSDRTVECQGDNAHDQASPPADSFTALSAGGDHTCALDNNNEATCWGAFDTAPAGSFEILTSGDHHTCGIKNDNSVVCWGDDNDGQIAVPDSPAAFAQITAGGKQTCGLDAEGHAFCWGDDEYGQSSPAYGHFIAVDTAGDHTCALRDLGSGQYGFTCWGAAGSEAPQYQQFTQLTTDPIPALEEFFHPFFPDGSIKKPKAASVCAGSLPPGICTGTDCGPGTVVEPQPGYTPNSLSGSGMNLYGTPTVPGQYEFAIQWTDDSAIPLIFEHPYWLTVTGTDLKVELVPHSSGETLAGMEFRFDVIVTNKTALTVPDVTLTLFLPNGFTYDSASQPECGQPKDQKIECNLGAVNPGQDAREVAGTIGNISGTTLTFGARVDSENDKWPEIEENDNYDSLSIPVSSRMVVIDEDFEEMSDAEVAPNGEKFILRTSTGDFSLDLKGLPEHRSVRISFDLYVIGNWLGNNAGGLPSLWSFGEVSAAPLIETSFSNDPSFQQAYPGRLLAGNYRAQTGATGTDLLGYTDADDGSPLPDARYRLSFRFAHTGEDLELVFLDENLPEGATWGLDNIILEVDNGETTVFLPMVIASK